MSLNLVTVDSPSIFPSHRRPPQHPSPRSTSHAPRASHRLTLPVPSPPSHAPSVVSTVSVLHRRSLCGYETDASKPIASRYISFNVGDSGVQGIEEAAVLDVIALGYIALGNLSTVGSVMDVVI
ncbi:hypothetical protein ACS0TY_018928 [Phlomoides rotata]